MVIRIAHGTYDDVYHKTKHRTWRFNYPLYRNTNRIIPNLPCKFRQLIYNKFDKFFFDLIDKGKNCLEFTFGYDEDTGVMAIAIVHPKDNFSRKIGYNIVHGRILRQNGNIESRYKYHPLPVYIEVIK